MGESLVFKQQMQGGSFVSRGAVSCPASLAVAPCSGTGHHLIKTGKACICVESPQQ